MQNLICMRMDSARRLTHLVGRVLALPGGGKELLPDANAFVDALAGHFGLADPAFADLWPQVVARHETLFGDRAIEDIPKPGTV